MKNQVLVFGLLAFTSLTSFALPTRADEANVQTSGQEIVITGDGNTVRQSSNQSNRTSRRGKGDNAGVAQDCQQLADIQGNDNTASQGCRQRNSSSSRRNR
ncbi:hypothetical protein [Merismopedia glauca]|uniref:Filamentous hemagglutinin n=1 Tax=Merismopedia glauca CCAP 1448/3 TaxID=1296344 RepID=A0A2T1BXT3_9CYAN|nr:hypothetical protein [Merismopedia glauca]PSB00820.1 hypothetical protein C7B64_21490 [Merismopedia glauca CCAP 1448/3]